MSKIHRNDPNKKKVKEQLIYDYGNFCMCCNNYFERSELQLHHIIKFEHCHCTNTAICGLLCIICHKQIHYEELHDFKQYTALNQLIINYKQKRAS